MITMARFRWSGLRLPVVLLLLRPFLVAVIMLLSELLMTPGLGGTGGTSDETRS